jgi:hypothetical protein
MTTLHSADRKRQRLAAVTAAFLLLHAYHGLVQGGGGWNKKHHGLRGAIWQFFMLNAKDPVLSAGMSDFVVVAVMFAVWMVNDLPAGQRNSLRVKIWLVIYTLFPGLGALLYRLWLKPSTASA